MRARPRRGTRERTAYICRHGQRGGQSNDEAAMSDKEAFLAHVAKLVAWLHTCGPDRVDARSDIRVEDYSQGFVVWLISRFPPWHGLPTNRPDMWMRSLDGAPRGEVSGRI